MPSRRAIGLSIVLIGALAGCGTDDSAAHTPTASAASSAGASGVPSRAPSIGPKTGQTDTAWGRIWDSLPSGFPTYPGATPDEAAGGGPASAVLVVEGLDAAGVTAFLQTQLERAGWTAIGSSDPLEDGSVVLDMTGQPDGCMLEVSAKPTGGLTTVTILYGADCPFD